MKKLRTIPAFRLVTPYMLGILLSIYSDWSHPALIFMALGAFLFAIYSHLYIKSFQYRWFYGVGISLFLLLWGFHNAVQHNELNNPQHFKNKKISAETLFLGQVSEMPLLKEKRVNLTLNIQKTGTHIDSLSNATGKLIVYIDRDSLSEKLAYNDVLILYGKARIVTPPNNPEAFNYKSYLHSQNIHYQSFIQQDKWLKVETKSHFSIFSFALQQRNNFLKILKKHLVDEESFSVGSALILGYKNEMNEEIEAAYAETGAMHVLAVSGLHVGLIYLIIGFLFDKLIPIKALRHNLIKGSICLFGIWAFALLTGASPSVLRASTMFSVIIGGTILFRNTNIYNSLSISAFLLLFYNPYILLSLGFQLSYLAVIGIVYFQPKFYILLHFENKLLNAIWQLTTVSFAAQLATLPLSIYYFHQFPMYFWLSGLVVVPAASIILSGGILLFLVESIFPAAGVLIGIPLYYFISLVNWFIFIIQKLPISLIEGIWISGFIALFLYISMLFLVKAINTRKGKYLVRSVAVLGISLLGIASQKTRVINNRQIIVYDIYKKTAIDFIDNDTSYSLISKEIEEKDISFSIENYRYSQFVDKSEVIHISDSLSHANHSFLAKNNFIQFYDKKIFMLNQTPKNASPKIKVDYLFVNGNPKLDFTKIQQFFDFEQVIFDNSNSKWKVEKWKTECAALGINYHYTAENAAWILNLKQ